MVERESKTKATMIANCGVDAVGKIACVWNKARSNDKFYFQFIEGKNRNLIFECNKRDFVFIVEMNRNGANK